jgi:hypothetical protein
MADNVFDSFFDTIYSSFLICSPKIQREPKMILPATATLATASHCSAVETGTRNSVSNASSGGKNPSNQTSPSMPGPSNKCDFGASKPMPQQPQQRSALTTLPTAPAAGTGKSFN